ncbi:uncharacterized mitochondrial protein-like protein [Tanacetum coccineum]
MGNNVGLRWVPTGKKFTSSTTKVDCEPPNGSNEDITNPYKFDQTLNVSADNTSGPIPQRKESCTLQCALSSKEEKSSSLRPFSSTMTYSHILGYYTSGSTMPSEHSSSGLALHEMTPTTISSRLLPNPPPPTPFVPPSRTHWDIFFQPLFDEVLNPPSSVDRPTLEVIALIAEVVALEPATSTGSPSSIIVDQDAPSPNVAHMNNDPFFGISIPENVSEASSSSDVIPTIGHTAAPNSEHLNQRTIQACWIEAMQEELNEFQHLEVWELVPRHDKVMVITLKWIYKLKKAPSIGLKQAPLRKNTPIVVRKSKLDDDTQGKPIDPTHYHGMVGTLMYLTVSKPYLTFADSSIALTANADADHAGWQDTRRSTSGCMQLLGDRLVSWSSKRERNKSRINKLGMRSLPPRPITHGREAI